MIPIWLEVHVDGVAIERALPWRRKAAWEATATALDDLARRAERHGARLSFRVREAPAKRDDGLFRRLVARGHEVGWHAHGDRLAQARDAVVAAGGTAEVATPGMVQARDWRRVAAEAQALGATLLTDRVEAPIVQYQGIYAWEPLPGLLSMDVSVSPFAWGVLRRDGRRVVPGRLDIAALMRLVEARDHIETPRGALGFFGATFHDHDIADVGTRAALERFFQRYGARIVPSNVAAREGRVRGAGGRAPPQRPPRFARLRRGPSGLFRRVHQLRLRVERRGPQLDERVVSVDGRASSARRVGPGAASAVLVLVHGGGSGVDQGLAPFGLSEAALAEVGLAAWTFARSEGARPPGSPETVAETRAVLALALAEGPPVVLLTWSAGLVPALRAAVALGDPRIVALVDGEGPADRWSLVPPGVADHPLAALDPWDDAPWEGAEAIAHIAAFTGRYLRVQAEDDHVHGPHAWHAARLVGLARDGRLNADGRPLPGRIEAHGDTILGWIRELAGIP